MSTTLTIAKREFRSNFDSPLAYIVICTSLVALGIKFFLIGDTFWQADRASVVQLFVSAPRGLALLIPVVTMRLLAEEKRSGTLEMLITLPVKDHEVIIGKFIGAFGLVFLLILTTVLFPLMMFWWPWHLGALDWGPVGAGYLGLILYSAAVVSIGLLVSSLTESQVIAILVTWMVLFVFHGISYLTEVIPVDVVKTVGSFASFDARIAPFARGIVNSKDVIFFLSITIGCLMASYRTLERRKWA